MANVAASYLEIIAEERNETLAARRRRLFREPLKEKLLRWLMGTAYACHPKRIADLPFLLWDTAADISRGGTKVPSEATTRRGPTPSPAYAATSPRSASSPPRGAAISRGATSARSSGGHAASAWCFSSSEHHISKRLRREMRKTDYPSRSTKLSMR